MTEEIKGENNLASKHPDIVTVMHKQAEGFPKSGRRTLRKVNSLEKDSLTYVEKGLIQHHQFCEQDFKKDASSYIWKEYKREGIQVRGVLLDNNVLLWFPLTKDITPEEINKIARERHMDAQIVATLRFGEAPLMGGLKPEIVIKSRAKAFDTFLDPLVNYFGKSLGWEEGVDITIFNGGERKHSIHESLSAYLAFH
jgi:hypothetical protein